MHCAGYVTVTFNSECRVAKNVNISSSWHFHVSGYFSATVKTQRLLIVKEIKRSIFIIFYQYGLY